MIRVVCAGLCTKIVIAVEITLHVLFMGNCWECVDVRMLMICLSLMTFLILKLSLNINLIIYF